MGFASVHIACCRLAAKLRGKTDQAAVLKEHFHALTCIRLQTSSSLCKYFFCEFAECIACMVSNSYGRSVDISCLKSRFHVSLNHFCMSCFAVPSYVPPRYLHGHVCLDGCLCILNTSLQDSCWQLAQMFAGRGIIKITKKCPWQWPEVLWTVHWPHQGHPYMPGQHWLKNLADSNLCSEGAARQNGLLLSRCWETFGARYFAWKFIFRWAKQKTSSETSSSQSSESGVPAAARVFWLFKHPS